MLGTDKIRQIVSALDKRTRSGDLEWTLSGDGKFILAAVGSYIIELHEKDNSFSMPPEPDYVIKITDGEIIFDSATDEDLNRDGPHDDNYYKVMRRLYQQGRRQAIGTDYALDEILRELEGDN